MQTDCQHAATVAKKQAARSPDQHTPCGGTHTPAHHGGISRRTQQSEFTQMSGQMYSPTTQTATKPGGGTAHSRLCVDVQAHKHLAPPGSTVRLYDTPGPSDPDCLQCLWCYMARKLSKHNTPCDSGPGSHRNTWAAGAQPCGSCLL